MSLNNYFDDAELSLLITALEAQERKWNAVADRPYQGFGSSTEIEKKKSARKKAIEYRELQSKIVEYAI